LLLQVNAMLRFVDDIDELIWCNNRCSSKGVVMLQPRRPLAPSCLCLPLPRLSRLLAMLLAAAATAGRVLSAKRVLVLSTLLLPASMSAGAAAVAAATGAGPGAGCIGCGFWRRLHEHGVDGQVGVLGDAQALPLGVCLPDRRQ
jgi:hypothetical protein